MRPFALLLLLLLFSAREVVTAYDESYPGGKACTNVACRTRRIEK